MSAAAYRIKGLVKAGGASSPSSLLDWLLEHLPLRDGVVAVVMKVSV